VVKGSHGAAKSSSKAMPKKARALPQGAPQGARTPLEEKHQQLANVGKGPRSSTSKSVASDSAATRAPLLPDVARIPPLEEKQVGDVHTPLLDEASLSDASAQGDQNQAENILSLEEVARTFLDTLSDKASMSETKKECKEDYWPWTSNMHANAAELLELAAEAKEAKTPSRPERRKFRTYAVPAKKKHFARSRAPVKAKSPIKAKTPVKRKKQAKRSPSSNRPASGGRSSAVKEIWSGPPDEPLEGGWPEGWMKRVFRRASGATKGDTDRYWYSPVLGKKFRSMNEVRRFMAAMKTTGNDEEAAWRVFKR
jgi:hypothetical protein